MPRHFVSPIVARAVGRGPKLIEEFSGRVATGGRVHSFDPVAGADAKVLILGSMPGVASLRAGEYYAHPRNLFWPILGELAGAGPQLPYADRVRILVSSGIALWDVLKSCTRAGSLDSAIERGTVVPNDFGTFFARHQRISRVYFNGSAAESSYRRHVLRQIGDRELVCARLPSTSPAHAARSFAEKLEAWRVVAAGIAGPGRSVSRGRGC